MPMISAMPSTGNPTCPSTSAIMMSPALGTAAVPIEASVAVSTTAR